MGINVILPLIIGIGLMLSIGTTIAPSIIENIKLSKIENRTIANQEIIKDAIIRYIKIYKKIPFNLDFIKKVELLKDYHFNNLFNEDHYTFTVNKKDGIITIFTKITDTNASRYFTNSFKLENKPSCVEIVIIEVNGVNVETCKDGLYETTYFLDSETFKLLSKAEENPKAAVFSNFTKSNLGKKQYYKDNPPQINQKDYVIEDAEAGVIKEYVYKLNPTTNQKEWVETAVTHTPSGGIAGTNEVNVTNERITCTDKMAGKDVFALNQTTGLGEFIWVAPLGTGSDPFYGGKKIRSKIFGPSYENGSISSSVPIIFTPNNICTSNLTTFYYKSSYGMFEGAQNFNHDINRWDTSNVTMMTYLFSGAPFNKNISSWCVSKITSLPGSFGGASGWDSSFKPKWGQACQ